MALILPRVGLYTLVTRAVDAMAFSPQCAHAYILEYTDDESPAAAISQAVRSCGVAHPRIGSTLAGRSMSVVLADELRHTFSDCEWTDGSRIVWDLCAIKSAAELGHMREASRINGIGLRAAADRMAPGVADHEVAAALVSGMLDAGSHMTPGYYQVVSGVRSAIAHATHNGSVLAHQDHILFEFSSSRYRYNSPLMRTITVGEPSGLLQEMHAAAQSALEAAMAAMGVGAVSADVHEAANDALDGFGMRNLRPHRTGYMVGASAAPSGWPQGHIMNLRAADPGVLQEGMTFHLPLALYRPGQAAIGVSETVLVTPAGGEAVGDVPRGLLRAEDAW
jgi:Xaa-Pro aminopeptidase